MVRVKHDVKCAGKGGDEEDKQKKRMSGRLVQQDGEVFVQDSYITLLAVSHTGSPVPAYDTVPCRTKHLVKVLLNALGDVLLRRVETTGLNGAVQSRSLHVNGHVCGLDPEVIGRHSCCRCRRLLLSSH